VVARLRADAAALDGALSRALRVLSALLCAATAATAACAAPPLSPLWLCAACREPLAALGLPRGAALGLLALTAAAHAAAAAAGRAAPAPWRSARGVLGGAAAAAWLALLLCASDAARGGGGAALRAAWLPAAPVLVLGVEAAVAAQAAGALRDVDALAGLQYACRDA